MNMIATEFSCLVINNNGYNGAKVDLWSCGVILSVLMADYLPFEDSNLVEILRHKFWDIAAARKHRLPLECWSNVNYGRISSLEASNTTEYAKGVVQLTPSFLGFVFTTLFFSFIEWTHEVLSSTTDDVVSHFQLIGVVEALAIIF
ncbi:hypothetical protein GQ457_08G027360 [Hibiscus cannabinus]